MRAGQYVKQLDGYRAFIPDPLPPEPPLEMERELLITFLLCQWGILKFPLLYLSHYLKFHRAEYYDRLMAIRNDGHWEAWLKFFLRGVGEVSRSATETARRILELRQKHLALIRKQTVNQANAAGLLDYLFEQPIVTARLVEERLNCSFVTADKLLRQFAELKIVKETTGGQRYRRFEYSPYMALFEPGEIHPLSTKRK